MVQTGSPDPSAMGQPNSVNTPKSDPGGVQNRSKRGQPQANPHGTTQGGSFRPPKIGSKKGSQMGHDPKGVKSPTWGIVGYFGRYIQNRHNDRKKGKKGEMANMAKRPELAIFGVSTPQKSIFGVWGLYHGPQRGDPRPGQMGPKWGSRTSRLGVSARVSA